MSKSLPDAGVNFSTRLVLRRHGVLLRPTPIHALRSSPPACVSLSSSSLVSPSLSLACSTSQLPPSCSPREDFLARHLAVALSQPSHCRRDASRSRRSRETSGANHAYASQSFWRRYTVFTSDCRRSLTRSYSNENRSWINEER